MGGLTKEKFGANSFVYHKLHYNIRGQLFDVRASNVNDEWGGELGALVNYYSMNCIGDAITGQNDFRIGGRQVISQHFQGRIDEVRVYNRALTATEVSALANGPASALLAVSWLVADHLGTPRMIIDQTGTLGNIKRHDYLPSVKNSSPPPAAAAPSWVTAPATAYASSSPSRNGLLKRDWTTLGRGTMRARKGDSPRPIRSCLTTRG